MHIHRVIGKKRSSLVTFLHVPYYQSFLGVPAATLSKTSPSFLRHSPPSVSYSPSPATGAKISTMDPTWTRWMSVTSSASARGDPDSDAALLRARRHCVVEHVCRPSFENAIHNIKLYRLFVSQIYQFKAFLKYSTTALSSAIPKFLGVRFEFGVSFG